jgi:hypothetical protein
MITRGHRRLSLKAALHPYHFPSMDNRMNEGCEYRERVGSEADGLTLLAFLSLRYCDYSEYELAVVI